MRHLISTFFLIGLLTLISGCQSGPWSARYNDRIDDISDHKLAIEGIYEPGLDVSRAGMPDWRRYGRNHKWRDCKCRMCQSRSHSVEYPAFYTLRYYAEKDKMLEHSPVTSVDYHETEEIELAPLPLPKPALDSTKKTPAEAKLAPPAN
ncbi:MAG: hypothetical protein JKY95_05210 [Planctomycetaceae bacterium]|nr:hypothetical protein [Planctomycetaceae bacterium]